MPVCCLCLAVVDRSPVRLLRLTMRWSTTWKNLEQQVKELRAEVAALKDKGSDKSVSATVAPVQSNSLVSTASAPGAPPASPPSLAGLLGPTSSKRVCGHVLRPKLQQSCVTDKWPRFFDGGTNQFGLNMIELVVDKTPEVTNSRTGYHLALGFGQAMNAVNGSDHGGLGFDQYLKEAYFSYLAPVGKGLQVDVGKFVTPHGAKSSRPRTTGTTLADCCSPMPFLITTSECERSMRSMTSTRSRGCL